MAKRVYQIVGNTPREIVASQPEEVVVVRQSPPVKTQYVIPADNNYYDDNNVVYLNESPAYYTARPNYVNTNNYVYIDDSEPEEVYLSAPPNRIRTKPTYVIDDSDQVIVSPRYKPTKTRYVLDENRGELVQFSPRAKKKTIKYVVDNDDPPYEQDNIVYRSEEPRSNRVYRPPPKPQQEVVARTQSVDWVPRRSYMYAPPERKAEYKPPKPLYKSILNKPVRKPNHRREIDEPEIRDKPTPNKNVIHGGAVVYK